MKHFLVALQFLTILPIRIKGEVKEKDFGRALVFFPVIGLLIGLLLSITAMLLGFLPNLVRGVFILIVSIIVTGGMHLDGFADTCDGFYGSKPKEKILQIMRDSRIGVMGVVGIICLLLLKFTLIVSIPQDVLWNVLIMMTVFARWAQIFACYTSNYARKEGKARHFIEYAGKREFFMAGIFTLVVFMLLMKFKGIILSALSIIPVCLFVSYIKKKIGGMTGDTIGAASEIAEVTLLFFALIW